jgi:hypothetical protein
VINAEKLMRKKHTNPSRRSLIVSAPALLLAHSKIVDAASRGGSPNTWPGQSDNPVGYAASPGYPGALIPSPTALTANSVLINFDWN